MVMRIFFMVVVVNGECSGFGVEAASVQCSVFSRKEEWITRRRGGRRGVHAKHAKGTKDEEEDFDRIIWGQNHFLVGMEEAGGTMSEGNRGWRGCLG
jgi:hypothetical protein